MQEDQDKISEEGLEEAAPSSEEQVIPEENPEMNMAGFAPIPETPMSEDVPGATVDPLDPALLDAVIAGGDIGEAQADPLLEAVQDAQEGSGSFPDPNENPDPIVAVEEMLSQAVVEEPISQNVTASPALEGQPTFQVQVFPRKEQEEFLQKIAKESGLSAETNGLSSVFSKLSEFQLIQLVQKCKSMGISHQWSLVKDSPQLTEEDLALGDLLQSSDAEEPPEREGAPAVQLPQNHKDVLMTTLDDPQPMSIIQNLGIVTIHRSLARRFFREDELQEKMRQELSRYHGKDTLPKSKLDMLFHEIFFDMQKRALSQGGNAVLGVKIQCFPEISHLDPDLEQMRLVAIGTAAVVEKA